MRKLASIQIIKKLEPIEGADRIEKATVLGWNVVVQKGLYHEGDRVVYLEVDSVLPKWLAEKADFTDSHLKTRRFRGVYSQGMCIPIDDQIASVLYGVSVAQGMDEIYQTGKYDGEDVTKQLGIEKWEPDQRNDEQWWKHHQNAAAPKKWYMKFAIGRWFWKKFLYKPVSGPFPTHLVHKTDETRVQVLGDVLEEYKGTRCQYTEKLDGSSITFWTDWDGKFHVCSRNREIYNEQDFMFATALKYKDIVAKGLIYQGEILGPNIQGNKYGLKDYAIYVYQVYNPEMKIYFDPIELERHLKMYNIPQVPILGELDLTDNIDELVEMAIGMSVLKERGKDTQREGIVIRPLNNVENLCDSRFVGGRLSFKAINPKFLIKYDK